MDSPTPTEKPTLFLKSAMTEPRELSCARGTTICFSTPSPLRTTPNEDAAAVIPVSDRCVVLVVADGVGGMKAGHTASASAVRALRRALRGAQEDDDDLRTRILDGIEMANDTIIRQGLRAATTLAIVEIGDGYMRPYHVGDSMILQVSARGDIKWSALSHAPLSYAVEAGVMTEEDAMLHPERNIISNVVGDRDMWIEIGPRRKLGITDTVVVASDGLCDNLSSSEVADLARRNPLAVRVGQMIDRARDRMQRAAAGDAANVPGKPDDLTALVYRRDRASRIKRKKPAAQPAQLAPPLPETPLEPRPVGPDPGGDPGGSLVISYP